MGFGGSGFLGLTIHHSLHVHALRPYIVYSLALGYLYKACFKVEVDTILYSTPLWVIMLDYDDECYQTLNPKPYNLILTIGLSVKGSEVQQSRVTCPTAFCYGMLILQAR